MLVQLHLHSMPSIDETASLKNSQPTDIADPMDIMMSVSPLPSSRAPLPISHFSSCTRLEFETPLAQCLERRFYLPLCKINHAIQIGFKSFASKHAVSPVKRVPSRDPVLVGA